MLCNVYVTYIQHRVPCVTEERDGRGEEFTIRIPANPRLFVKFSIVVLLLVEIKRKGTEKYITKGHRHPTSLNPFFST